MRVIAVVSDQTQYRLAESCLGKPIELEQVEALTPTLPEPDVVALETRLEPGAALQEFAAAHPCVGVLVIGQLASELAHIAADLGHRRAVTVVLEPYDVAQALGRSVMQACVGTVPRRLLRELADGLEALPAPTQAALERLVLTQPPHVQTIDDFASFVALERRTIHRHFLKAGLPSPKEVLRAARLLRGLPRLYGREPFPSIAEALGYRRYTEFQIHVGRIFGGSPRHIRYHVDPIELPTRIASALRKAG